MFPSSAWPWPWLLLLPLLLLLLLLPSSSPSYSSSQLDLCDRDLYPPPWQLIPDKISVLISGFAEARLPLLKQIARSFSVSPIVHSIYILWGNTSTPWALLNQTDFISLGSPVFLARQGSSSLNERFSPRPYIRTRSVLICDDDITMELQDLKLAFQIWKQNEERIVGFFPRSHEYHLKTKSWIYTIHPDRYSIMLTKSMILATDYLYKYTCEMPSSIREYIDRELNCEDIAMNFIVANTSNRGPLLVKGKLRDYGDTRNSAQSDANVVSTSALSAKKQHRKRRGDCITDFHRIWGAMPLRYSYGMAVNAVQEQALCEKHGVLVLCSDQSES